MLSSEAWVAIGLLTFAAVYSASRHSKPGYKWTKESLELGLERPPLWIYVNEGDVNSRVWQDFGARSSRVLNVPLLNLCYQTIVEHNGMTYRVEVIRGLQDLAIRMGGWEALPSTLRERLAPVGKSELHWIQTAVLAKWGGLWLSPSVICIQPFPLLPKDKVVGFGTDWTTTYGGVESTGTRAPGIRALWSPYPDHPMMVEWEERVRERLESKGGGRQVRNDAAQDWIEFTERYSTLVLSDMELDRKGASQKRIELEDLLAVGMEGALPFPVSRFTRYVPIPWDDLQNRRTFGWILRMSEEQILESDIVLRRLFTLAGGRAA